MGLRDMATLATDADFRQRVLMAMVTAALQIVAEDPATENHAARAGLAVAIISDPYRRLDAFALTVASNVAITTQSTDNDIQFTVNSDWNAHAGVVTVVAGPTV